jgi:hypothetical protein
VSTQLEPHCFAPPAQVTLHCPIEHTWPAEHAVPHPPQFAGSFCVSTHADPQSVEPPRQLTPHWPIEQT